MRIASAWALLLGGAAGLVAFPACLVLAGAWRGDLVAVLVLPVSFAAAGAVALRGAPANPAAAHLAGIGAWHLVAVGLTGAATLAAATGTAPWPLVLAARTAFVLGFVSYLALFAAFPDGRHERTGERRTVQAGWALGVALPVLGFAGRPAQPVPVELDPPVAAMPPVYLPALAPVDAATYGVVLAPVAGLVLFALRYHRGDAARRERMRWPLVSVVLGVAAILAYNVLGLLGPGLGDAVFVAAFATLPVVLVIGMVRHRLLDVDLVLRRSLVYAVLWLAIGGAYVATAAALGLLAARLFPLEAAVAIAIGASLLFAPARRRLERLADRLVFGDRLPRYELLRRFGEELEAQREVTEIGPRLAAAVARGLDARWVRVDLPGLPAAADPGPAALTAPVVHDGELLGEIRCGPRRTGEHTAADRELLATLARQTALAARTAGLAADLQLRLQELAASRARIVAAADAERRRIERDLHDGIQQDIVVLLAKAGTARTALARDPAVVDGLLEELQDMARRAHAEVRALARGILPAVLGDRGLVDAVEAQAAHLPVGVRIDADPALRGRRYPAPVELAAWFVVAEGLTNAVKHSGAADAVVRLHSTDGVLRVTVGDSGCGFDPATAVGSGLTGLRDRIEALGGRFEVDSAPGRGTCLAARLPVSGGGDG